MIRVVYYRQLIVRAGARLKEGRVLLGARSDEGLTASPPLRADPLDAGANKTTRSGSVPNSRFVASPSPGPSRYGARQPDSE